VCWLNMSWLVCSSRLNVSMYLLVSLAQKQIKYSSSQVTFS